MQPLIHVIRFWSQPSKCKRGLFGAVDRLFEETKLSTITNLMGTAPLKSKTTEIGCKTRRLTKFIQSTTLLKKSKLEKEFREGIISVSIRDGFSERTSNDSPSCWDLFQQTHKVKGDTTKWVSSKSESIAAEYERRIAERDLQQPSTDDASCLSDNSIFLEVVGGVNKKGRVYGLGPEGKKYKPSTSTTSFDGVSQSEYEEMRTLIANLTAENKSLNDKFRATEEMVRSSQEESRLLREQMYEFMRNFSLGQPSSLSLAPPPPPPPPPTNQKNHQQDDEDDEDNDDGFLEFM